MQSIVIYLFPVLGCCASKYKPFNFILLPCVCLYVLFYKVKKTRLKWSLMLFDGRMLPSLFLTGTDSQQLIIQHCVGSALSTDT